MENTTEIKIQTKHIRVFISSTFKDMQDERDIIVKKVFPRLRVEAEKRGINFSYVDLRWGIRPNASSKEILDICLYEIENCHPYFIGLIGSKYGSIVPRLSKRDQLTLGRNHKGFCNLWNINRRISYTEVEIKYYKLLSLSNNRTFFYLKDIETPNIKQSFCNRLLLRLISPFNRRNKLVDYLYSQAEFKCSKYSSFTTYEDSINLEELIYNDFINVLNEICPNVASPATQLVRNNQESFFSKTLHNNFQNENYPELINDWANQNNVKDTIYADYFLLIDKQDNIKTLFLADFINQCASKWNIIYHFVGRSQCRETSEVLLLDLISQVCNLLRIDTPVYLENKTKDELIEVLTQYLKRLTTTTFIVIDNLDLLECDLEDKISSISWLPNSISNLKYLISASNRSRIFTRCPEWIHLTEMEVSAPSPIECFKFTKEYLKAEYGKSEEGIISPDYYEKEQHAFLRNRGTLRLFLDLISSFDYGVQKRGGDLISNIERVAVSKNTIIEHYVERIETEIFRGEEDKAAKILTLLAMPEFGLYENDIVNILSSYDLNISQIEWSKLYCHIKKFILSDGYITISQELKRLIISKYVPLKFLLEKERISLCESLLEYNSNNCYTPELAYQYLQLQNIDGIRTLLTVPQKLIYLYKSYKALLTECLLLLKSNQQVDLMINDLMKEMEGLVEIEHAHQWELISNILSKSLAKYKAAITAIDCAIGIRESTNKDLNEDIEKLVKLYHEKASLLTSLYSFEEAHTALARCSTLLDSYVSDNKSELLIKNLVAKANICKRHPYHKENIKAVDLYRQAYMLSQEHAKFKKTLEYLKLTCQISLYIDDHTLFHELQNEIGKMINNHLKGTRQYFQALLYYRTSKKKEIDKFHRTTENYKLLVEDLLADLDDLININGQYIREYAAYNMTLGDVYYDYAYSQENNYSKFVEYSDAAVKHYDIYAYCIKEIYDNDSYQYAHALFDTAKAYQSFIETRPMVKEQFVNKCISMYKESDNILSDIFPDGCCAQAVIRHNISRIYCDIKQHNIALQYIDKAICDKQRFLDSCDESLHLSFMRKFYILQDYIIHTEIYDENIINKYREQVREYYKATMARNDISDSEKSSRLEEVKKYDKWINKWTQDTKACYIEYANTQMEVMKKMFVEYLNRDTTNEVMKNIFASQYLIRWKELSQYITSHSLQAEIDTNEEYHLLKAVATAFSSFPQAIENSTIMTSLFDDR